MSFTPSTKASVCASAKVTQLAEGLGFDLADAFAGDLEALADFFQGVLGAVFEAKRILMTRSSRGVSVRRTWECTPSGSR